MRQAHLGCWLIMLACTSVASADEVDDAKRMQGSWVPAKAVLAGRAVPDEKLQTMTMIIADATFNVRVGEDSHQGAFQLKQSANPREINLYPTEGVNNGKTFLAIYELQGGVMRVCYSLDGDGGVRPASFSSTEENRHLLITYRRN